ncbi:MAG: acyl carrier protein [Lachnospiraceae bacterium]|nr:acyl carrier protein [Lachnospiraceae bacterium]
MKREEIIEKLKEILVQADERMSDAIRNCELDSDLRTDLGLTSVGMLYTVIVIEETFGIRFENVGMNDFATLGDVVDYLEAHMNQ